MIAVRIVAIVQARMGSSRLPGKVLLPLAGTSAIGHLLGRLGRSRRLDAVMVATTVDPADDALAAVAERYGAAVFRGDETDVLGRYAGAAEAARADVVARVTSDCPLFDAGVLDAIVAEHGAALARDDLDYASNTIDRTYPRGLDVEVFSRRALLAAAAEARDPVEREHVTQFFRRRPERFRLASFVRAGVPLGNERWTLDTPEDYRFLQAVFGALRDPIETDDVLRLLAARPDIRAINAGVEHATPF
jgi:spore coat polysaccharide biosynthesis protein SpsF